MFSNRLNISLVTLSMLFSTLAWGASGSVTIVNPDPDKVLEISLPERLNVSGKYRVSTDDVPKTQGSYEVAQQCPSGRGSFSPSFWAGQYGPPIGYYAELYYRIDDGPERYLDAVTYGHNYVSTYDYLNQELLFSLSEQVDSLEQDVDHTADIYLKDIYGLQCLYWSWGSWNWSSIYRQTGGDFGKKRLTFRIVPACSLRVTNFEGTDKLIDPSSGGSIGLSGSIHDKSNKTINWTISIAGKTYTGTGPSPSTSWDGKLASGKVVEPGTYNATLAARTDDGKCSDSKTISFTVKPPQANSCGLYVDFGSSAHVANGNLIHSQTLFSTTGSSLPSGMTLYYNSLDPVNDSLGQGWSHNYAVKLKQNADGSVLISEPNWKYQLFDLSNGSYIPKPGNYASLVKNADSGFTLTDKDGTRYNFTATGTIINIVDRNGNTVSFAYTDGNLVTVTDPSGRITSLDYDAGNHLTTVTDPAGNRYTLTYSNNTLTSVTNPDGGKWSYSYDANAFMLTKADPQGNITTYTYDDRHRALTATDPEGQVRSITYPTGNDTAKTTTFTEKDGGVWQYRYDTQSGTLTSKTDPQEGTTTYTYDSSGNRLSTILPDGSTTSATYDTTGNMLTSTDALGKTTTYTYNNFGQMLTVTDPQGGIISYTYDAKGNLTATTDATGATTKYEYDAKGNLTKITDPAGAIITYTYDSQNNQSSVTDPSGATYRFSYDAAGNLTASADPQGGITTYTYDSSNHLIRKTDPLGNTATYTYNQSGNKTGDTDANGNVTKYEYNSKNQMTRTIDALNNTTSYGYGGSSCPSCGGGNGEKITSLTDANGNTTRYLYDQLGRLRKETDPLGHETNYSYDARGNLLTKTDANGSSINYMYDATGRLLKKTYPDNTEETYTYDGKGNILTAANSAIAYTFSYDRAGRMTSATDSSGRTIRYEYSQRGSKVKTVPPDGTTITYGYDSAGRLTTIATGGAYTIGYDSKGQRISLNYPNGDTATYTYDKQGRLTDITRKNSAGVVITGNSYTHDKVGNRLSNTTPERTGSYSYDNIYRLLQTITNTPGYSSNSKTTKGTTNAVTRQKETYTYDSVGNRLTSSSNQSYTYNAGNQLITNGGSYHYDDNGNLAQKITPAGTTTYTWDFENRLTKVTTPTTTAEYAYDPLGRRIQKQVTEGGSTTTTNYFYDGQNILFEYDETGIIGNRYTHGPNIDEPLAVATGKETYYYHQDGLGSVIALTDKDGKVVQAYKYDSFGNLKDQKNRIKQPFTYTGREWDRETGLYYYRARYYDPMEGRFVSKDPIGIKGGINLYSYTKQNPINYTDPSGLKTYMCKKFLHALGGSGQRSGPDIWGNPFYHQYICVLTLDGKRICGGQDRKGGPWSDGMPSDDSYSPEYCEQTDPDNECFESCLLKKITSPDRPYYGLFGPGTNCQEWANETYKSCKANSR